MEFSLEYFFYFILGIVALSYLFLSSRFFTVQHNPSLPPGSLGWPIIGETLDLIRLNQSGKPEEFIKSRMNKYNKDIFKTSIIGKKTIALCGSAGNKFLFTSEKKFVLTTYPNFLKNFYSKAFNLAPYDEAMLMRKIVVAFLHQEVMQQIVERFDQTCKKCFRIDWIGKDKVMAFSLIKKYSFSIACELFASMDDPNWQSKMLEEFNILVKGEAQLPINFPGTSHYKAVRSAAVIRQELIRVIDSKRRKRNSDGGVEKDLISHLMDARDENGGKVLSDTEIADNVILLMDAGHGTSSSTMMMLMKYLAEMPDVYRRVLEEQKEISLEKRKGELLNKDDIQKMKYSWNVVSEVLRVSPPVLGSFRKAIVDFTYAGFSIPKDWTVWWNTTSTHKVAKYFQEPEKFDPMRFDRDKVTPHTFVPFGGGPRMCPGKDFARLEMLVFLHNLINEFKWQLVFPNENITMDPMPTPSQGLPVYLFPHTN